MGSSEPDMTISNLADAILASESDAIVATDAGGLITFWNPGAARIFGYSEQDAIGRSLDLIIPENQRARHWDGFHQVMKTGTSRYGHGDVLAVPALRKQGDRISVEFTIVMLRDAGGRPSGMAAILRDVSARFEEMRTLRRALAEKQRADT
jgi:PAS domain S-box-containing protein